MISGNTQCYHHVPLIILVVIAGTDKERPGCSKIQLEHFLRVEKNNLSQYVNKFMELVYDDLKQLLDMQPEEIIDVLKEVALYDKSGHRKP